MERLDNLIPDNILENLLKYKILYSSFLSIFYWKNDKKKLSGILGGEKAAHYALCMNNGYNLTDTKEGKHSKLFD